MKIKKDTLLTAAWIIILVLSFIIFWCNAPDSDKPLRLGVEVPKTELIVKLADVIENPDAFNGKKIVMNGVVFGQCGSLCDFFFKDGIHTVTIYPQGFKFPKLEHDKPVTIYTEIIKGDGKLVFLALGIEI
jgi:hypothetical protein